MRFNLPACFLLCLTLSLFTTSACDRIDAQTAPAAHNAPNQAHAPEDGPADLKADARLDRPYSLHEIGIPLDSLLHKLSHDDLSLSADRNCDTLKLQLHLVNRPLRQIMNAIADLVPGDWYKTLSGKGYILQMSWTAVRRRQRWWDLYLGEWERVMNELPGIVLQAMRTRPKISGEVSSADGNVEGLKKQLLAGPTFFNQLPASMQERIAGRINEMALIAETWQTGMIEGATVVPFTDLPSQVQTMLSHKPDPYTGLLDNSYVLFEATGSGVYADVWDANGDRLHGGYGMDVPWDLNEPVLRLGQGMLVLRVRELGQKAPPAWKELADYRISRVWLNTPTKDNPTQNHSLNGPAQDGVVQSGSVGMLEQLADEDHLEFVSDYYASQRGLDDALFTWFIQPLKKQPIPRDVELDPHAAGLNQLVHRHDLSWKRTQKNIYLIRNNRWYQRDRLEVPVPLLRRWLDIYAREWAKEPLDLSVWTAEDKAARLRQLLDWQAEVVSSLTLWQVFDGLRWAEAPPAKLKEYISPLDRRRLNHVPTGKYQISYAPFSQPVQNLAYEYHLAQFYASLNVAQRTALFAGDLDFYILTPDQEQAALYLQPLLQLCLDRRERPILLSLKGQVTPWNTIVHLVSIEPPGQIGNLPVQLGQEQP